MNESVTQELARRIERIAELKRENKRLRERNVKNINLSEAIALALADADAECHVTENDRISALEAANAQLRADVQRWIQQMRNAGAAMSPREDWVPLSIDKLNELAALLGSEK